MTPLARNLTVALFAFLLLNGCNQEKNEKKETKETKETFHTYKYYKSHPDIRKKRIKECEAMETMTEVIARDCQNADRAEPRKLPVWPKH